MGTDPTTIAFYPTDTTKSSKLSAKELEGSSSAINATPEDPLSDDEMEEEYRSLLIRKHDQEKEKAEKTVKSLDQTKYVQDVFHFTHINISNFKIIRLITFIYCYCSKWFANDTILS